MNVQFDPEFIELLYLANVPTSIAMAVLNLMAAGKSGAFSDERRAGLVAARNWISVSATDQSIAGPLELPATPEAAHVAQEAASPAGAPEAAPTPPVPVVPAKPAKPATTPALAKSTTLPPVPQTLKACAQCGEPKKPAAFLHGHAKCRQCESSRHKPVATPTPVTPATLAKPNVAKPATRTCAQCGAVKGATGFNTGCDVCRVCQKTNRADILRKADPEQASQAGQADTPVPEPVIAPMPTTPVAAHRHTPPIKQPNAVAELVLDAYDEAEMESHGDLDDLRERALDEMDDCQAWSINLVNAGGVVMATWTHEQVRDALGKAAV